MFDCKECATRPTRKQENVSGRRLSLSTTSLRSPPMHRRTAIEGKSLGFSVKGRESCGGPELWIRSKQMSRSSSHRYETHTKTNYENNEYIYLGQSYPPLEYLHDIGITELIA